MSPLLARFLLSVMLAAGPTLSSAIASAPFPDQPVPVIDRAHLLSGPVEARLQASLRQLPASDGFKLSVVTVQTMGGRELDDFLSELATHWQLPAGDDDLALLLVVWRERTVWIGRLGAARPAAFVQSPWIIHQVVRPAFRQRAFDRGVEDGIAALLGALRGSGAAVRQQALKPMGRPAVRPSRQVALLWLALILGVALLWQRRRSGSASGPDAVGATAAARLHDRAQSQPGAA